MKTVALLFGAALGLTLAFSTVQAAEKLKDVTCEKFLAMDESNQNAIVYWINGIETGHNASKTNVEAADIDVGYDIFGWPVAEIVTECKGDVKASLWQKVKGYFHKKTK